MKQKKKLGRKILSALLTLAMVIGLVPGMPGMSLTAKAECYPTVSGNTSNITYSDDGAQVTSVVSNFSYVDSGNFASNPGTRYYNMIFTTNQEKTTISTAWRGGKSWSDIASEIGNDSIYNNSNTGSSNVQYKKVTNAQAKELTNAAVVYDTGDNTQVTGTYTISDSGVLGQFQDGKTYYGLLCSAVTGGVWYTGTYVKVVYNKTGFVASITDNVTTTKYGNLSAALSAWTDGSTLTLLADVETANTISVSGTKILDLNGYGIKMTGTGRVLNVENGASLTLNDGNPSAVHKYTIADPKSNGAGLAVVDDDNGNTEFTGGYITGGNESIYNGGGVQVDGGSLTMTGGTVIGNKAADNAHGGGIAVISTGTFEMSGGAIIGNAAPYGGGLSFMGTSTATIEGGEIKYNYTTRNGGGIHTDQTPTLTITGGKIINNYTDGEGGTAGRHGGGLMVGNTDNKGLNLSGNPTIEGNQKGEASENIYLYSENKINITGILNNDMSIGVTLNNNTAGVFTNSTTTDYNNETKFTSDNSDYSVIKNSDGQLSLVPNFKVTFDSQGGSEVESKNVINGSKVTKPENPTKEGYKFGGWYKEAGCTTAWNFDSDTVTTATTLYAKWTEQDYEIDSIEEWNEFVENVNAGETYAGRRVVLTADIGPVTEKIKVGKTFNGTFDGGGHLLTVDFTYGSNERGAALFPTLASGDITVKNLKLAGVIRGGIHAAGIFGEATGKSSTITIDNVMVCTTVIGGSHLGGIVGHAGPGGNTCTVTNSQFLGTIKATTGSASFIGGLIGWGESTKWNISDCKFGGRYGDTTYFNAVGYYYKNYTGRTVNNITSVEENKGSGDSNGRPLYSGAYTSYGDTSIKSNLSEYNDKYDDEEHGIKVSVTEPESKSILFYGESDDYCLSNSSPTLINVGEKKVYYHIYAWDYPSVFGSGNITITKGDAVVTTAPAAEKLIYSGESQDLVTAGTAKGGEMQYALGTDATTVPTTGWGASIPTGIDAGTYYVWYKVVGDSNHEDYIASSPVPVTIDQVATVTYKENGAASGSVPTDNTAYSIGNTVTVLGNTGSLTRAGYTFDGWNTKADGSGTAYAENAAFTITEDTTLFAQWMKDYAYLDAAWNATTKQVDYTEKYIGADKVTVVNAATTKWNSGWYAVTENVTISGRVTVSGDVKLILSNGATLTATNGISVDQGNTFTVYGQTLEQNDMGSLYSRYGSTTGQAAAGIGGSGKGKKAGKITINGGKIFTSGSREAGGAGIGGGFQATGTDTTINGGYITIPARKSVAGIGGGREASSGNITINGGDLNVGGYSGASIGGSYHGSANTITIRGGYIKATNYTTGAAIGSGQKNNSSTKAGTINISGGTVIATNAAGSGSGAAAIGGGYNVPGGTVNISGGEVIATSTYGAGIGGGPGANGGTVKITGGTVTAYSSSGGVGIGAGKGKTGHGTLTIASTHVSSAGNSESTAAACFNYASHRKKYVKIWEHTHSKIDYGIDGNVLYAQCNEPDNCNMLGGRLTLTLDAVDKLYDKKVYDKAKTTWTSVNHNEWDEFSKITGTTASSSGVIEYYKVAAEGSEKLGSAPVDEGKYIAKLPVVINSQNKYLEKEFEIVKPEAYFVTVPEAKELTYTGGAQDLITAGVGKDGTIHYSLDNKEWNTSVPQGTDAGTYSVWFKVVGDDYHNNSGTFSVDVTIRKKAALTLSDDQKPTARTDFPKESEKEEGEELVIAPKDSLPDGYKMYYAVGEDETTVPEEGWSTDIPKGMEGTYYIWFKVVKVDADGNEDKNYEEAAPEVMKVEWIPEYNVIYDENESTGGEAPVDSNYYKENDVVKVLGKGGLVKDGYVFGGWYTKGEDVFVDEDASAGEESSTIEGGSEATYKIYQAGDTFSIASDMTLSAKWIPIAKVTVVPAGGQLTYSGGAQELVTAGKAEGGTILYALGTSADAAPTEESAWSTQIPAAANSGTYHIWYKVVGDDDHADSEAACVDSTIIKADLDDNVVALTMKGYSYGTEPSVPAVSSVSAELNTVLKNTGVAYYYNTENSKEGGTEWKDITGKTLNAGRYYMYAKIPATENYNEYTTKTVTFMVEKATWTKTQVFGSANAGTEGSVDLKEYIAEGGKLGSISIDTATSQDESYPSVKETTLTFKFKEAVQGDETIATVTIPVTGAANYKDYKITAEVSAPAKSLQALIFSDDQVSKTYGDETFTISPTRGTGERDYGEPYGAVTFTSSNPDVAVVDAATGEVTVKSAGTTVITAEAARTNAVAGEETAKPGYLPAAAGYTLNVNKKVVTVKAENQSIYVGDTIPDLTNLVQGDHYTVEGLVGQDELKNVPMLSYQQNGKKVNPVKTKPGTYDIVPSGTGAGSNYTISYESGTLTITDKKEQIITAENVTVTYGETGRSVNASVTEPEEGGGEISYAVKDGSADYIEVDSLSGALTIKKVPAGGKAYVTVTAAETDIYAKTAKDVTVTINKTDIKEDGVTVTMENYSYGMEPSAPAVSSVSAELNTVLKNAEVKYYYNTENSNENGAEWKDITGKTLNAGTYYMYAEIPATANYNGYTTKAAAFTVEKATWTKTQVYGSANAGTKGSVALKDYIAGGGILGDFTIDNKDSQDTGYPSITGNTLTFKFKETAQGDDTIAVITIPVAGGANYKDYTITAEISAPAKVPQILTFGADNVSKTYGDKKFTINPDRGVGEGDYGEPYGEITYESSDPDVAIVDVSTGEVTIKGAGTCVITAEAARTNPVEGEEKEKPGYLPAAAGYTLTVGRKAVTVKAKDQSINVGDTIPDLTNPVPDTHYTIEGLVGQDGLINVPTMSYQKNSSNAEPNSNKAGTYDIVPSGADAGSNYMISYESGVLTINRGDIKEDGFTVTMKNYGYGMEPSAPAVSSASARLNAILKNAEVKYYYNTKNSNESGEEWKDITGKTLNAGTYYMYAKIPATANYNGYTTKAVAFTVEKATWTKTQVFGSANAGNEGSVDLTGYIAGGGIPGDFTIDNEDSQDTGYPSIEDKTLKFKFKDEVQGNETTAVVTIKVTGAVNYNDYEITAEISAPAKIPQILTFDADHVSKIYGDKKFTINPDRGKGEDDYGEPYGEITYSSSDPNVAIVDASTGEVTIIGVGTCVITAKADRTGPVAGEETTKPGYLPAAAGYTLTVGRKAVTVKAEDQSIYVGDTIPDLINLVQDVHYTVTGLVGQDGLINVPMLSYQKNGSNAEPDSNKAGTYDIVPSGAEAGDNYTIRYESGKLTIANKAPDVNKLTVTKTSGADKNDGVISGLNPDEKYEYSTDGGKTWIPVEEGKTTIENLPAGEVLIRKQGDEDVDPSEAAKVTVGTKGDGTAPDVNKLTVTKTSGADNTDGVISGLEPAEKYEYSTDGGKTWTPVEPGKTTIENLPAGEVLIRKQGDEDTNPGEATKVTVGMKGDGTAPDVNKLTVTKTSGADNTDGVISGLDPEEKYEYSTDGGKTWTSVAKGATKIEKLAAGKVLVRIKGTDDKNPSDAVEVIVGVKKADAANFAINKAFKVTQKGSKITVRWGKVEGATGYEVYVAYCGKNFSKTPAKRTTTKTSTVVTKIGGKKINLKKNFKVYVVAVKKDGSKKTQLAKTITGHIVGSKNTKYTNVKSITLKTKTISVAVGKTSKIKAKTVLVNKKKKQLSDAHAAEFRYASTDESIAIVDKNGNVKGVSAGTTTVYVYARNGYAKTVRVTVK